MFVGIEWWQCLYKVLLGSSKAGLGSCLTDHLLISLQKVSGVLFCFVLSGLGFVILFEFLWVAYCYEKVLPGATKVLLESSG